MADGSTSVSVSMLRNFSNTSISSEIANLVGNKDWTNIRNEKKKGL